MDYATVKNGRMRTLVDIEKDITKCKLMIVSATAETKRALDKRIEQLEWERLVVENGRRKGK